LSRFEFEILVQKHIIWRVHEILYSLLCLYEFRKKNPWKNIKIFVKSLEQNNCREKCRAKYLQTIKRVLNPNFLNLTINREKIALDTF